MKLNNLTKNLVATAAVASLARHAQAAPLKARQAAATLTFVNLDGQDRNVVVTGNPGTPASQFVAPGGARYALTMPANSGFNVRAVPVNSPEGIDVTGNLGEFTIGEYEGQNDFDVSSINNVRSDRNDGINTIVPESGAPVSGCPTYNVPCVNAYNQPNDVETKSTTDQNLFVYMGVANG